ncbi:protein of unknown function DUF820 [Halothece sp. PCC 7418]|uniref:Uma2 family endonuclease n=1 Tax=Halothece sp. (strain PCC 7418) TaxID=65093 RepID=UPI0002A066E5|nr:Uma2 family endonuclease [Halothece sp. PCC 7418]AFZ42707.1 protein of unknown function DUF820 [Halothece sp. PCC 7418]
MSLETFPLSNLPPLENGDHLTRDEFERRCHVMSAGYEQAELIEGVVYMPAALRFRSHSQPHALIMAWLSSYWLVTPNVELGDNPTVRLDASNEPQPDAVLLLAAGGQTRISEDDYIEGAPELIVEVAASSSAIDLYEKKNAYERNGVKEYLVWQVLEQKLDWFCLNNDHYFLLEKDETGVIRSQVFPGLWLAVTDLLQGNRHQVIQTLQQGLTSPEHQAFVNQFQP